MKVGIYVIGPEQALKAQVHEEVAQMSIVLTLIMLSFLSQLLPRAS